MANSDFRFVYFNDDDELTIVTPSNESDSLDVLKTKDCPNDRLVVTVENNKIPNNEEQKKAWVFWEETIENISSNNTEIETT